MLGRALIVFQYIDEMNWNELVETENRIAIRREILQWNMRPELGAIDRWWCGLTNRERNSIFEEQKNSRNLFSLQVFKEIISRKLELAAAPEIDHDEKALLALKMHSVWNRTL